MDVSGVVGQGNRRRSLEAIRNALAAELDTAKGPAAAMLARELRATLADLAALPDEAGGSPLDDIVANVARLDDHRRTRRPKAAGS